MRRTRPSLLLTKTRACGSAARVVSILAVTCLLVSCARTRAPRPSPAVQEAPAIRSYAGVWLFDEYSMTAELSLNADGTFVLDVTKGAVSDVSGRWRGTKDGVVLYLELEDGEVIQGEIIPILLGFKRSNGRLYAGALPLGDGRWLRRKKP